MMARGLLSILLIAAATYGGTAALCEAAERPRVIVSTDVGGSDPDDFQSMVHYLVYADRFDTEGLVSSPPQEGRAEHLLSCIEAYAADYENLRTWSDDYPSPDALRKVVRQGAIDPQSGDAPDGASDGARLIIDCGKREDSRPLYVLVWGSITDVAQAVHTDPSIKRNLRVYSIGSWNTHSDRRARDYLFANHPDLWWIEADGTFRGMYMGGDQSGDWGNDAFPKRNVNGRGKLGALFMDRKADIKMGDSPSVLYLLHGDPDEPESDHWGGAFIRPRPEERPTYWHDNPDPALAVRDHQGAGTVSRWRRDFLADWAERMERAGRPRGE